MMLDVLRSIPFSTRQLIFKYASDVADLYRQQVARGASSLEFVANMVQDATEQIQSLHTKAKTACSSGCTFCCYLRVEVTCFEADAIVEALFDNLTPQEWLVWLMGFMLRAEQVRSLSERTHKAAHIPCMFLNEANECGIYPVRPMACVACNSTDRGACERADQNDQQQVPMVAEIMLLPNITIAEVTRTQAELGEPIAIGEFSQVLATTLLRKLTQRWGVPRNKDLLQQGTAIGSGVE